MQRAEAPDQVDAVDADDFAVGKELGESVERDAVVWIVKCGHENEAVGDVEVGVTGREALAAKDNGARHGQLDDRELLALRSARGFEAREILGEWDMVGVARDWLNRSNDPDLTLPGSNTYTGGTTISAGTLQVGNGSSGASIGSTSSVLDNASLVFNHADSVTFPQIISGSGSLTQMGTGILSLTGNNTYSGGTTISAGTLQVGNGGTTKMMPCVRKP